MSTMIFFALLVALLVGLVVGAVVGVVLGYDKAVVDAEKKPKDMRVEIMSATEEEYLNNWREDLDDPEG